MRAGARQWPLAAALVLAAATTSHAAAATPPQPKGGAAASDAASLAFLSVREPEADFRGRARARRCARVGILARAPQPGLPASRNRLLSSSPYPNYIVGQVGDSGKLSEDLKAVAQQMGIWRAKTNSFATVLLGDNFYQVRILGPMGGPSGVDGGMEKPAGHCLAPSMCG